MKIENYPKKSEEGCQPLTVKKLCECSPKHNYYSSPHLRYEVQLAEWGLYKTCYNCYGLTYFDNLESYQILEVANIGVEIIYEWLDKNTHIHKNSTRENTIDFEKYQRLSNYLRTNFVCSDWSASSILEGKNPDKQLLIGYIKSLANSANNLDRRRSERHQNLSGRMQVEKEWLSKRGRRSLSG